MFKEDQPIFHVNECDLLMHQSISRLSSRQMHKQKTLWKTHLKYQGFKINIAGQGRVDQLRKERVDDLYEITSIKGNVGTEKKQYTKKFI